jgi:hypothetical protein
VPSRNELYAGMEHKAPPRNAFASDRSAVLNSLASTLAFVPGVGDVAGLAADADMYATDPKSRNWKNYLLTGLGALPFVGGASLLGRATRNVPTGFGNQDGMITYHGSPHRINNVDEANPVGKFDLSKVGTGEGAQAYGHGVYLAESPDVARQYAGSLSAARATQPVGNVDLTQLYQSMPNDVPDNLLAARRDFRELQGMGELSAADRRDYLQAVQNNIVGGKGGNFYTVDLPDEHIAKMLDWDAPLSEQPESVRKAIADRVADVDPDGMDLGGGRVLRNGSIEGGRRFPDKPYPWVLQAGDSVFGLSEKDVRRMVGESVETLTGEQAYARLSANMGSQAKATEFLRSVGLPGIKYFDGGSRGAGQGTRNFVIFDGDTAKILKRE